MEDAGGNGGDGGLRFSLQFDPGKPGLGRTLLGFPVSALLSHLLGWSSSSRQGTGEGSMAMAADGGGETAPAAGVAVLTSAFAAYLVSVYASDHRRRPRRRLRLRPRLDGLDSSAARPRAVPTPDDGLRIVSSNEESLENVIHGASVGAGDDEPDIVARVVMTPTDDMAAGANADGGETGNDGRSGKEREEEVARVKELWLSLMEREQRLQLRLAELDELREQEANARELERRVGVAAVEARLLELKAASLQEENRRLEAQASELDAVRAKLARTKEKLRELRARVEREQEAAEREAAALRDRASELERNGEARESAMAAEAAALRCRVAELEKGGEERERALAAETEAVRQRMAELEKNVEERERALAAEEAELRTANAGLEEENMELALRLQEAEQTASTVNLVLKEDVVKEATHLRETNERLTRQIEQLHADHCAHVEELVYLKWVNACLRYELRSHDDGGDGGGAGRLSARDLSKSMSFRSSEKAKELMLKYGTHGLDGFDPSIFSPLHESLYSDDFEGRKPSGDVHETPRSPSSSVAMASAAAAAGGAAADESPSRRSGHGKLKFLGNIKKLLPTGKKGHGHGRGDRRSSKKATAPPRDEHLEKALQWLSSHDALYDDDDDDDDESYGSTPLTSSCERTPLSSVTTTGSMHARIGGGGETASAAASRLLEAETARTRSDAGASYAREPASRYHALRPDHPARDGRQDDDVGPRASPERRELRRRSEELRSPAAMYASARRGPMQPLHSNA
ncbi:protein SOGA3-like isoform X2 [Oryza brachyantha]|uniref:protein SOGA3-like isoform X2 n=1 Tax=Oryza brachyantha TaxID=4533 RepID=UPI001AD9867B|nr:protein SOGA3-like isoform X2 [Oryza brachyantha]